MSSLNSYFPAPAPKNHVVDPFFLTREKHHANHSRQPSSPANRRPATCLTPPRGFLPHAARWPQEDGLRGPSGPTRWLAQRLPPLPGGAARGRRRARGRGHFDGHRAGQGAAEWAGKVWGEESLNEEERANVEHVCCLNHVASLCFRVCLILTVFEVITASHSSGSLLRRSSKTRHLLQNTPNLPSKWAPCTPTRCVLLSPRRRSWRGPCSAWSSCCAAWNARSAAARWRPCPWRPEAAGPGRWLGGMGFGWGGGEQEVVGSGGNWLQRWEVFLLLGVLFFGLPRSHIERYTTMSQCLIRKRIELNGLI